MSAKKLIIGFFTAEQIAAAKAAGHHIIEDVKVASLAVEGAIIASPVGAQIAKIVADLKDSGKSGVEKGIAALADATPLIEKLASEGTVALIASAEDTARAVVQTIYNATIGKVIAAA